MTDYKNLITKLPNKGLDVTSPPDTLEEGKYTRLVNVKNALEGVLTVRDGLLLTYKIGAGGNIHTMRRLNDTTIIFSKTDGTLWGNEIPIIPPFTLSGNPLSTVRFHTALTGRDFIYIADTNGTFKIQSTGTVYKWGITPPATAPNFVAGAAGLLLGNYDWRFTYYSTITGAESNPSPLASQITLTNQQGAITSIVASTDPQVDTKRIYRRGGVITDTWQFVAEIPNNVVSYTDNFADDDILEATPLSLDNGVPFTTVDPAGVTLYGVPLPFIFGPFIGKYIFAFGDPVKLGAVYWTNPDLPDSASSANFLNVTQPSEPIQAGFIFNENPYIWTRDNLYTLDYGGPDAIPTFIPRLVSIGLGLSAPYAFALGNSAVFFLSKDGIYATDCQSHVKSITDTSLRPIFFGRVAGSLQPIDYTAQKDIRLFYASQEIHFFYKDTSGNYVHLVYDLPFDRWREFSSSLNQFTFGYGDENQSAYTLLLAARENANPILEGVYSIVLGSTTDTSASASQPGGVSISVHAQIRTGSQDAKMPLTEKEWGSVLIDADMGSPTQSTLLSVTPYINAEATALPTTLLGPTPGRQIISLPLSDTYSRSIGFDIQWNAPGTLYQLHTFYRPDEERITHWEHPDSSHDTNMGWMHIRDAFFCLRSTANVTLTHTIDGLPFTYVLPSTGDLRRRIHVYLAPVKGKVFKWELNSTASFKFYGEDSQIFIKPWNSALSYQPLSPFRGGVNG